jgi:beta-lactamase regulating signal transducer with metallopeptidase domain
MSYDAFISVLGRLSAQASILVILVVIAQWIFKERMSPQVRCALWLLPALRLIIPATFSSGVSVYNLMPGFGIGSGNAVRSVNSIEPGHGATLSEDWNRPAGGNYDFGIKRLADSPVEATGLGGEPSLTLLRGRGPVGFNPTRAGKSSPGGKIAAIYPRWDVLLFAAWAGIVGFLLFRVFAAFRQMVKRFHNLRPLSDAATLDLFETCRNDTGVRVEIALFETARIASPALFGFLRPRLILPAGLREALSQDELRFVFLHELAHVRRRDILFNWVGTLLQIVHWFNPLIWFAFARWRADREMACDALAIEAAGFEKRDDYGRTILRLLAVSPSAASAPAMAGILEDKSQVKERISMIAAFVPRRGWPLLAVLLMGILAWVGLTDARRAVVAAVEKNATKTMVNSEGTQPIFKSKALQRIEVTNGPSVRFTVVDQNGKAVSGAEILAPHSAAFFGGSVSAPTWRTDADGHAEIRLGTIATEATKQMTWLPISIRHADFAPFGLSWNGRNGDVRSNVPSEIKVTLKKGRRIGGFIKDKDGKPIGGTRVAVFGSGYPDQNGNQPHQEYAEFWSDVKIEPAAIADANGHFEVGNFPSDLDQVHLTLMRPDGSIRNFISYRPVNPFNSPLGETFDLAKLREGNEVFVLQEGYTIRGIVIGPNGEPLAGLKMKEGGRRYDLSSVLDFRTDSNGRFELRNRLRKQLLLVALPDTFAITNTIVEVGPSTPEIRIQLSEAKPFRGKIMNQLGTPIPNAKVTLNQLHSEGLPIPLELKTDASGFFVWTNAPLIPFTLTLSAPELSVSQDLRVRQGSRDLQVKLRPGTNKEIHVKGRTVDAVTGVPVEMQSVNIRTEFLGRIASEYEVHGTEFNLPVSASEFQAGWYPTFKLEVVCSNYETFETEFRPFSEGDWVLGDIQMLKGGGVVRGQVRLPDGNYAAGAEISVALQTNSFLSMNVRAPGRVWKSDQILRVVADVEGYFQIDNTSGDRLVLITHEEGFLKTSTKALRQNSKFRLERWGRIEGMLKVGAKPLSNGEVTLIGGKSYSPNGWTFMQQADTFIDGKFGFSQVPPGECRIFRIFHKEAGPIVETYQQPVTVRAGETVQVVYGGLGRPVAGQVEGNVNWKNDLHLLVLKKPHASAQPRFDDYVRLADFQKANDEFQLIRSDERSYAVNFDRNGFFHIDDVPAGIYDLRIRVTKSPKNDDDRSYPDSRKVVAFLTKEVVVPEMEGGRSDEPLELGKLQMERSMDSNGGQAISASQP